MNIRDFTDTIGADFYTGVPDSQLKALCNYLMNTYGIDPGHHVIAANEGNCTALAAGYHLATGKVPVVYMQNSGEGNIINPVASLLNEKVYAIPVIFVVGWRGEPGLHDEPQHIYQGEVT
ncbi:MAG: phosphonopyruvate decarboxylase, partial [Lachnospiraceae bacterium]|nr:phosphonopyruvate decarboxylase [Lachnospiraceae bacterium]